jgi:glycosyl transferase family 25
MEAQLAARGLAFERLGHDFRGLDRREIRRWYAERLPTVRPPAYTLSGAELGCWASHLSAWARIHASGAPAGTVLEDDVLLAADFARSAGILEHDLGGFDLVYLGTSSRNLSHRRAVMVGGLRVHAPVGLVVNTWGYVVSAA